MGKNVAVKLPAANDPVWRKYYSEENEKLKKTHPGSTGAYRRRMIQSAWRKEHAPAEDEPVSSKNKSAQGKKGGRKSVSDESSGSD